MKKKILLVGHSSQMAGGGEDEFERLLKYFSSRGDQYIVDALIPEGPRANIYAGYCHNYKFYPPGFFPVIPIRILDYVNFFRFYFRQKKVICEFVKDQNYDLCILNVVVLVWPVWFLRGKIRMLVFIRETVEPKFLRKLIYRFLIKYVSYFIAVSDVNKEDFIFLTEKDNIFTLYSSIEENLTTYLADEKEVSDFIERFKIQSIYSGDILKIVCVGAINERKNQLLIVEALKVLKDSGKEIPYVYFIGDTNVYPKYFEQMNEFITREHLESSCHFLGIVDKKIYYKLLPLFDSLIISSKSEGLPLVLAEALKFKIPVVATDTGGIRNIIQNNFNGIMIGEEKKALAYAIVKLSDKKFKDKIVNNGYKTYKSKLNLDENFRKLEEICFKIIKQ